MKLVILAGGYGTRFGDETADRPKPMIEIGGRPILWHIMKICSANGINDFIICLGYKGNVIKEYFSNYLLYSSDITYDFEKNDIEIHRNSAEPWRVTLLDTGENTMTGGRLKRVRDHLDDEDFCFTYGDAVTDINICQLIEFHRSHDKLATVTAVQQPVGRFGNLAMSGAVVTSFEEKPASDEGWINGGFFILSPEVFDRIDGDDTVWENEPLTGLVRDGQLAAFIHNGFWHCMDTQRDRVKLESLWSSSAPWKIW